MRTAEPATGAPPRPGRRADDGSPGTAMARAREALRPPVTATRRRADALEPHAHVAEHALGVVAARRPARRTRVVAVARTAPPAARRHELRCSCHRQRDVAAVQACAIDAHRRAAAAPRCRRAPSCASGIEQIAASGAGAARVPSMRKCPWPRQSAATRSRIAVPAVAARSSVAARRRPDDRRRRTRRCARRRHRPAIATPSWRNAVDHVARCRRCTAPVERRLAVAPAPPSSRARFVMTLRPGTAHVQRAAASTAAPMYTAALMRAPHSSRAARPAPRSSSARSRASSPPRRARSRSASSASRSAPARDRPARALASKMSRHISGELAATRVRSRKLAAGERDACPPVTSSSDGVHQR